MLKKNTKTFQLVNGAGLNGAIENQLAAYAGDGSFDALCQCVFVWCGFLQPQAGFAWQAQRGYYKCESYRGEHYRLAEIFCFGEVDAYGPGGQEAR